MAPAAVVVAAETVSEMAVLVNLLTEKVMVVLVNLLTEKVMVVLVVNLLAEKWGSLWQLLEIVVVVFVLLHSSDGLRPNIHAGRFFVSKRRFYGKGNILLKTVVM